MRKAAGALQLALFLLVAGAAAAAPPAPSHEPLSHEDFLPPDLPWDGASRQLALPADSKDPWITPFEQSGRLLSPSYDETVAWLRRLADASPELEMVSLGKSGEGRDLWMVIASRGRSFTPAAIANSNKPVILVQAGIHAGEIDGKDAGMMLLRDLTLGGEQGGKQGGKLSSLLDGVELLFVPIFNVDGHERRGPHHRINQRGPEIAGWRTTARNLNLNRDYMKADAPEMQAMLAAFSAWQPDLYIDVHVTDGIDYQYDVTWGYSGEKGWSPSISRFFSQTFDPPVTRKLEEAGHVPGYLIFALDSDQPDQAHVKWQVGSPRFSDSYGAVRHMPSILVENHSLKSHERRVLGTYVFLEAVLETVGKNAAALEKAIAEDQNRHLDPLPLRFTVDQTAPPNEIEFLGVEYRHESSTAAGTKTVFTGKKVTQKIKRFEKPKLLAEAKRPKAYLIPPEWTAAIAKLKQHGIRMEKLDKAQELEVEMYRLEGAKIAAAAFEGRVAVELEQKPQVERRKEFFPAGTMRISTDQPLGDLAMMLLEPESEDSLLQWGYFLEILNRTEYAETYVMAPMAEKMLQDDPALAAEFAKKLEDKAFADDPQARLQFFYQKTPYFDDRHLLYPVARE